MIQEAEPGRSDRGLDIHVQRGEDAADSEGKRRCAHVVLPEVSSSNAE
jgi:hypothetical protein